MSLLTLLCLTGAIANAATLNVPTPAYPTIQAAINAANTGDHVAIAAGTYLERINFNGKAITVRSTDPTNPAVVAATVIDGQELDSVVTFASGEGANSVLSGLTITNGEADSGGGIYCDNSSPTITNNNITGNSSDGLNGGGIYCEDSSPTITNNTITANSAEWGGGICCLDSSPTITNNTISENSADFTGGGIYCNGSSPAITNNTISENSAGFDGGGICCDGDCSPTITNNTISNNSATFGGGIYCNDSSPAITNNTISDNRAQNGGGICRSGGSPAITNNTISGNSAEYYGGGICCRASSPSISSNTISGNSANHDGGGICCELVSNPTITNTIVAFSTNGVGIYAEAGSNPTVTYCDVYGNADGEYGVMPDPTGTNGNISQDPLFAAAGSGDYHLKSTVGRWNPSTASWVTDAVHSPCIDAGDPSSAYSNEPVPKGSRINMGAYGNTTEASMSSSAKPATPTDLTATLGAERQVDLSWTDNADTEDGFTVQRRKYDSTEGWPATWTTLAQLPADTEEYTDDTISEDGQYQYRVRAYNAVGPSNWSPRARIMVSFTKPPAPTDFAAAVNGSGEVELSWTDNADNEDGFKLRRRKQNADGSWPAWSNLTRLPSNSESHTDDTITEDGRYQYGVRAFNDVGPSAYARVGVWRVTTTPAAPTDFAAAVNGSGEVELSWTDNADNEDGFKLRRRKRNADGSWPGWSNLTRLPSNSESHTDDTVTEDGRYQYGVRAFNRAEPSAYARVAVERLTGAGMPAAICSVAVTQANGQFVNIVYGLSADADVAIEVRNIAGRLIRAIPCGTAAAGLNTATWNLRNAAGAPVPSGVYLCTITARADDGTQATAVRTVSVRR